MAKFIYNSYLKQTVLYQDSKDEAIEKLLKTHRNADDSEESKIPKNEKDDKKTNDGIQWETNTLEDADSEW